MRVTRSSSLVWTASHDQLLTSTLSLPVCRPKGVGFRCLQQGGLDTDTSTGKLLLGVLASIAEFETDIRKERQREGINRAKIAGVYKGRKPSVDVSEVRALRAAGVRPSDIASNWGLGARAFIVRCPNDMDII